MIAKTDGDASVSAQEQPAAGQIAGTAKPHRTRSRKMTRQVAGWQLVISSASSDQTIQSLMSRYNFGPERITQEGAGLLAQVRQCINDQVAATGRQRSAQGERDRVCKEVLEQYTEHKALARVALRRDLNALKQLGLQGRTRADTEGWLAQARQFYSLALGDPAIQMRLVEVGLTLDKLEGGLGLAAQVDHCLMLQASTRSTAKESTRRRGEAIERMEAWMDEFRTIARLALREQPELLGKLGL